MTKGSERTYILKILEDMEQKELFASQVLDDYFYVYDFDKQQKSFISKVIYGMIEQRLYIDFALNQMSKVKVRKMKPVIRRIMRMSAYQILFMDKVPDHAAINEAVKLAKKRKFHQLSGFVNGVLRSLTREREAIDNKVNGLHPLDRLSIRYSMDKNLVQKLVRQYDAETIERFLGESLKQKKTIIRSNTMKVSVDELKNSLSGVASVERSPLLATSLRVSGYNQISELEAFKKGYFQVQDESSNLVGMAAGIKENLSVLDTCSAPGGKATHFAQMMQGTGEVIACDVSDSKLMKIAENVERLELDNVTITLQDATEYQPEFETSFDVVVCDAPCSGLGILRNKPDIKMNMTLDKMDQLVELQRVILENVKRYVKPGGLLVYSTCTVNKEENINQVRAFLDSNKAFSLEPVIESMKPFGDIVNLDLIERFEVEDCLQLMTDEAISDGFFIARMRKEG